MAGGGRKDRVIARDPVIGNGKNFPLICADNIDQEICLQRNV
jgi:hypothetical protein